MISIASAKRMGRAAHVLLHQPHAAGRLDVEPAAVEADALADDGDARVSALPHRARSGAARARCRRHGRLRQSADSPWSARRREVTLISAPILSACRRTACSSSAGPMSPAGVFTRSRTRESASASRTIASIWPAPRSPAPWTRAPLLLRSVRVEACCASSQPSAAWPGSPFAKLVCPFREAFGEFGQAPRR